MRTLLAGELTLAQSFDADDHVKLEVQNGSGTWVDVGGALGTHWIVEARWGETVDTPVSSAVFTLVQQIGTASLSPLMAGSPLNVNDALAYSPLLDIGRLVRASTAKMAHTATLDVSKYRRIFDGRIDEIEQADSPGTPLRIAIHCSDLGSWLQDLQIETSGVEYGTTPVGTALETVVQNILNTNIPSDEPAVTLYKQSASAFAVTSWRQGDTKVLEALTTIVLDSTGEDVRYRYDAAHASRLTWFNPDRTRATVDATFTANQYVLRRLNLSIRDIRNVGEMPYSGGVATSTAVGSRQKYRKRFFRLAASDMITTLADAQKVVDAVVNDLSAPPGEAAAECPYLWFVQLYDRYTFQSNARQYDSDQTFAVMGYEHSIENGRGTTTLTLTARIVGAYAAWIKRLRAAEAQAPGELGNVQWEVVSGVTTVTFERNARTSEVWAAATLASVADAPDWDTLATMVAPLAAGAVSFVVPTPGDGQVTLVQLEPRHSDLTAGIVRRLLITAATQPPHVELDDLETTTTGTQWWGVTERGIPVTAVEVQTQVGASPISGWTPPMRGPGDASTVRGGVLGAGEYEHDVTLDATRQSWIMPRLVLANDDPPIVLGPFGFDRDKNPNLAGPPAVSGSFVTIVGDSDARAVGLYSKTRSYKYEVDGSFAVIDVSKPGTGGSGAGLAAGTSDVFTAKALSDPVVEISGATLSDARDVIVGNGAAAPLATLDVVRLDGPSFIGDDTIILTVRATSAPASWTMRVWVADPSSATPINVSATLLPAVSGLPPIVETSYLYTAANVRAGSSGSVSYISVEFRVELLDATLAVQSTETVPVSYYVVAL